MEMLCLPEGGLSQQNYNKLFCLNSCTGYRSPNEYRVGVKEGLNPWTSDSESGEFYHRRIASLVMRVLTHDFFDEIYGKATGTQIAKVTLVVPEVGECTPFERGFSKGTETLSTAEKVARIRSDLSLNLAELARVLNVSRQAIYGWIEGVSIRGCNRPRLEEVFRISCEWRNKSKQGMGDFVRQPMGSEPSVLNLLSEDVIDHEKLLIRLNQLAGKIRKMGTESTQNRQLSVRELRQLHGISAEGRTGDAALVSAGKRFSRE